MKFALVAAFTLALAMGVQSSVYPLGHHDIALASPVHVVSSPLVHYAPHGHGSVAVHASALNPHLVSHAVHATALNPHLISHAVHASAWNPHLIGSHGVLTHGVHAPVISSHVVGAHEVLSHGVHSPVISSHVVGAHAHVVPAIEGQYIAKTRGAVHKAPLAGHIASAASINLAPAPGTI